jgi:hypothetical protein
MKKSLLLFITLFTVALSALAVTDGQTYPEVNGIKIVNKWIMDRVHTPDIYVGSAIESQRARTATMDQGIIYVARSEERMVVVGNDTIMQSVIHRFSAEDGSQLEDLPLYLNGAPYGRFLGVASIGKDSFHHIWVAPMTGGGDNEQHTHQFVPIYMVDIETGELTLITELNKEETLNDTGWPRTDYVDVIGDLTLEQAECNIMTVAGATADPGLPHIYRNHADQGGDWEGGFDGDYHIDIVNFYPDTKSGFSLAPVIKMIEIPDEEMRYSGETFYIDCFDTAPVVYNCAQEYIDSFEDVDPTLKPKSAPNGCMEFVLEGQTYFVYSIADMHGNGNGCQANICLLGDDVSLSSMTKCWKIPADSLGKANDSGLRVHCFAVDYGVDAQGHEEVTLLTFKAYNGMAVYKIGRNVDAATPDLPGDVNGDGEVGIADVNVLINLILDNNQDPNGDVNGDGEVGIADVNTLINLILQS